MKTPKVLRLTGWSESYFPEFWGTFILFCKRCHMPAFKHPENRCLFTPFIADYVDITYIVVRHGHYSIGEDKYNDALINGMKPYYTGEITELATLGIKVENVE